ncbi:unnamed protein product [Caenorhabditis sp. 36 PRJEB53466]|nr:unnamed protein product [Caenorhabditis sp. 36 PRJEB53466]
MSRQIPLVTKKEIIYRRSFIDDHNDRFESVMRNPTGHPQKRPDQERSQNVNVSHTYHSDLETDYQLAKINRKLDNIIDFLRNPSVKKENEDKSNVDNGRQEQTRQYQDICDRITKLEAELTGKNVNTSSLQAEILELTKKIHELSGAQDDFRARLVINNMVGEDIDELLKVINETRRDLEEKIGNTKRLGDGNYVHLEDKLDGYFRNQQGVQRQVDHLLDILAHKSHPNSDTPSRSASALGKDGVSRSSSKATSIKQTLVLPTSRSPPPKAVSEVSYVSTPPRTERSESQKTKSTVISSNTISSIGSSKKGTRSAPPPPRPPLKPARSMAFEVLEKTKSIETLNNIYYAAHPMTLSEISTSSESYIAPLTVNDRRNSQPANIYLTKKY